MNVPCACVVALVPGRRPGGLNEGAIAMLTQNNVYTHYADTLDSILNRLTSK